MQHTEKQLEENYNKFIAAIKKLFKGERLEKLLHMYSMEELGSNLLLSPASGNKSFHNAYEGGYIDHIMNVVNNSIRMKKLYESVGGVIDFTDDELLFAAFHHDLGKLGDTGKMSYIPNDSDWHVKNRGEIYKRNPELSWLNATDRTFYLLNKYGIVCTENEYFGIKLTDGLYDDDNKKYLIVYDQSKVVPTNMHHILHWADHMSTTIERDMLLKAPF